MRDKRNKNDENYDLEWDTIFIVLVSVMIILILSGCIDKQAQAVYIPTKCKIDMPKKPIQRDSTSQSVVEILQYSELLEKGLEFCVNGKGVEK